MQTHSPKSLKTVSFAILFLPFIGMLLALGCDGQRPTAPNIVFFTPTNSPTITSTPSGGGLGKIIFSSDRNGRNYEIYRMNADGSNIKDLTNHPGNDDDPYYSFDGSKIVFISDRIAHKGRVFSMNSTGGNQTQLCPNSASIDNEPAWSPDSTKIAFRNNNRIIIMNADGSHKQPLLTPTTQSFYPEWSPNGLKIFFVSYSNTTFNDICSETPDGNNFAYITNDIVDDHDPACSPDGSTIAMERDGDIQTIPSGGGIITRLTNGPALDRYPCWSPDGSKICFQSNRDGNEEIYVMDADGNNLINLTNNPATDQRPSWR